MKIDEDWFKDGIHLRYQNMPQGNHHCTGFSEAEWKSHLDFVSVYSARSTVKGRLGCETFSLFYETRRDERTRSLLLSWGFSFAHFPYPQVKQHSVSTYIGSLIRNRKNRTGRKSLLRPSVKSRSNRTWNLPFDLKVEVYAEELESELRNYSWGFRKSFRRLLLEHW